MRLLPRADSLPCGDPEVEVAGLTGLRDWSLRTVRDCSQARIWQALAPPQLWLRAAMIPAAGAGLSCSDVTYGEGSSDMARAQDDHLWALAHAERAALAEDLAGLGAEQWRHDTLCGEWDAEQVLAHLTAAASLNQWQWLRSMLAARFRPDVHNQRRLAEQCGGTPAETLDRFRAVITSTTAPSQHTPAYLGEVVVHAQDIRQRHRSAGHRIDPRARDEHGWPRIVPGRA